MGRRPMCGHGRGPAGARLSVASRAQAWFELREAAEQKALAEATVVTYERSLDVVQGRFDAGLSGALDLRLAEANAASNGASLVSAGRRGSRVAPDRDPPRGSPPRS